jgi:hypothetical protein
MARQHDLEVVVVPTNLLGRELASAPVRLAAAVDVADHLASFDAVAPFGV